MTMKLSTTIRTVGGASALALTAGLSMPAFAQSAPAPLAAPPAPPTAPVAPANVQQCVETSPGLFVCAPGLDPDGVGEESFDFNAADPIRVIIQDGAFLTGNNGFSDGATVSVDLGGQITNFGSIVSGADQAISANSDSVVNNLGWISSDSFEAIRINQNVILRNGGTIYGNSAGGLIVGFGNDRIVNNGLIRNDAGATISISAGGSDPTIVINQIGGSILGLASNANVIQIFENAEIDNDGLIQAFGTDSDAILVSGELELTNTGNIVAADGNGVQVGGVARINSSATGLIRSDGDHAILLGTGGSQVISTGTVISATGSAVNAGTTADNAVVNNGIMRGASQTIRSGAGLLVVNRGTLEAVGNLAIATTSDFELRNLAMIRANGIAVRATTNSVINNNGGSIVSATDTALLLGGTSTITNTAGALISGNVAIDASFGADTQTVVNFGSIVGTSGQAIVFGDGADEYQHWSGASASGNIRFGAGDDTFVLQGRLSTINGTVAGQTGNDTAILGGILDADNLIQFETISLGSLFDLTVSGNRSLEGATTFDGNVTFALGVDSLAVTGNVTLDAGSVITILTPLDAALVGQTVAVVTATGTTTNGGATVNIIDDDLLIDYTRVGNLAVQVSAVNPLTASGDPNLVRISNAVNSAIIGNTLSASNFAAFNSLTDAASYQAALIDALPSLSEGPGREIFETASAASQALDRHLSGEGSSVWGQFILRGAEQDALSLTATGYDADEMIFTLGGDVAVFGSGRVGLLASFADIDIEVPASKTEQVESIKVGAYVALGLFDRGFFNAEVAYLTGEVETARTGFFGPITSGFDFDGITGRAVVGYDLLPDEGVSITPTLGVNAGKVQFDDAVEAGGFGFTVERGDAEYIELRAGIELGAQISEMVNGFIGGTVVYDTVDTVRSFRLSSTELQTFFVELPLREQNRFELAAGLNVDVSENFGINVGYQGDFNEGYSAHSARATVKVGF